MLKSPKSNPTPRSRVIITSGYFFITINFSLGFFNIIIGLLSGSLAITSDAVHSFIDAVSGFFIIISEKLSQHTKLSTHHVKIERLTTILIAIIIIMTGVNIIVESIEKILDPSTPDYSIPTIIILLASIAMKYLLARYLKHTGKKQNSTVLIASAAETLNDTWISIAVLFSTIFYFLTKIDLEAYVSLVIALLVIKVGLEFIFPHLSHHHHHPFEQNPDHDHCGKAPNTAVQSATNAVNKPTPRTPAKSAKKSSKNPKIMLQ